MGITTRERILETIAQSRTITVRELSLLLHTTVANIRYHIDPLLEEQTIEQIPPDKTSSQRGRPASRFRLSEKNKPADFQRLSSDLLSVLMESAQDPEERSRIISQIARKRANSLTTSGKAAQRLNQVIDYLNRHAYRARWEARRAGPEIRFGNCPFALIVPEHPVLCEVDSQMIALLLDAQITALKYYQPDSGIPVNCVFALKFLRV
jgi:predicted ArsR family transcriptional regulator